MELNDNNAIMQVFGCLLKQTTILSETDRCILNTDDFIKPFHKYIFGAIYNLYINGASSVDIVEIGTYLEKSPSIYKDFIENHGIEFLTDAKEVSQINNFNYYHSRIKKFTLLRDLNNLGYDTDRFYSDEPIGMTKREQEELFDKMSTSDIFKSIQIELMQVVNKHGNKDNETKKASDGIRDLMQKLKLEPDIGCSFQNNFFNTITRGARLGKFYLNSGSSGSGKTRTLVGHAVNLAFPFRYNLFTQTWESTGNEEKVLIVTTEISIEEIQTLILSYLTGINEEKLLYGTYNKYEEKLYDQAMQIMEFFEDNLTIIQLNDPTRGEVVSTIRLHALTKGVEYIFYDYIFSSPGLLSEFKELRIREDECKRTSFYTPFPLISGVA